MNQRERLRRQVEGMDYKEIKNIKIGKFKVIVYPNVFPPVASSAIVLTNFFKKFREKYNLVLDIGSGSGVLALLISRYAKKVIATDISLNAIKSIKKNVKINNINNIEVRHSDLFQRVPEKFDLIIFNPPFLNVKPKSAIESALTDENYKTLSKFFKEVKKHLNFNGEVIIDFSDMGDEKYFNKLIKKSGFERKEIYSEEVLDFAGIKSHYYILKLILKET